MTLAEYAAALMMAPEEYADLPSSDVRSVTVGDGVIILAHPSAKPVVWREGQWTVLGVQSLPPGSHV